MSKTISQEEANMAVAVALQRNVAYLEREIESLKTQLAECRDKALEEAAQKVVRNPALRAEIRSLKSKKGK